MLTLTTPLLTFAAPPLQDNPSKYQANQDNPSKYQANQDNPSKYEAAQLERYQTNFQERREKRQEANAPALPFQETLLLDNQYRPDQYQYRSTYRLVGEGGLVKVQRKKVAKKKLTDSNIRVATTSNSVLPTQVLLGRVKVVVTEKPNLSEPRKRERESEENIWDELASFDRSQKRGGEESEPNLWRTEATDKTEAPSPRGLHELQMVNHNLRPRVYFLPS